MAINTRESVKEALNRRRRYYESYLNRFSIFFHNSVSIETSEFKDLPKRYLLRTLMNKGAIAFEKSLRLFLPFTQAGIDIYGLPTHYNLIGMNGFTKMCTPEEVVILRANDLMVPIQLYLEQQSAKLAEIDMAIEQNLEAIKTMTLLEVPDKATMLSFSNLESARQIGSTVAYVNKSANISGSAKSFSTGAEYLVDKLQEARREILNETFQTLGIGTMNTYKKERVQSAEVEASNFYTIDSINTLIDTFNYDADYGEIDIHLVPNTIVSTVLEDEPEEITEDTQYEEVEDGDTL